MIFADLNHKFTLSFFSNFHTRIFYSMYVVYNNSFYFTIIYIRYKTEFRHYCGNWHVNMAYLNSRVLRTTIKLYYT